MLHDEVIKKFEEVQEVNGDYEIETPNGFLPIKRIMKTIPYEKWYLCLEDSYSLECADEHIVYKPNHQEIFVKDIQEGYYIETESGLKRCVSCYTKNEIENMYDVEVEGGELYTNGITSHNTTAVCCYLLWYATFHPDKTVAIGANLDRTAKNILSDIKDMYNNIPEWMKMSTIENNAHTLTFDNGSKIFAFAPTEAGISGESVSVLYIDELSKFFPVDLAFTFWRNNIPTISHGEKVVITSTPKGVGNLFHKIWKEAVEGRNGFAHMRVDYWQCPEYNSEEWKEEMIRDIGLIGFNSEYGNQFVGSQATVIGADALKKMVIVDPTREEKIHGGYEKWWEEFNSEYTYVAAADIGLGSGNDYTTLQIYKIKWRRPNTEDYIEYEKKEETVPEAIIEEIEQVFVFRSNLISIPQFVTYTFETLQLWGDPYFIVENNGIGRSFVDKAQEDHYYENAYIHEDSIDIGIDSNSKTKTQMVNALKDYADKGKIIVKDMDTINELMTYIEKKSSAGNRRFQAEEGSNDDLVVGIGWVCFMVDTLWMIDALTYEI